MTLDAQAINNAFRKSKKVLIKTLADESNSLPTGDDLRDLFGSIGSDAVPAVVAQLETDGVIENAWIQHLTVDHIPVLLACRTVGGGRHASDVDDRLTSVIEDVTKDKMWNFINNLGDIMKLPVAKINEAVLLRLKGDDSGNAGLIAGLKDTSDLDNLMSIWKKTEAKAEAKKQIEEIINGIDDKNDVGELLYVYNGMEDNSIRGTVVSKLKADVKDGKTLIEHLTETSDLGWLTEMVEKVQDDAVKKAANDEILKIVPSTDKNDLDYLGMAREFRQDIKTAVDKRILDHILSTTDKNYFYNLETVRGFSSDMKTAVDDHILDNILSKMDKDDFHKLKTVREFRQDIKTAADKHILDNILSKNVMTMDIQDGSENDDFENLVAMREFSSEIKTKVDELLANSSGGGFISEAKAANGNEIMVLMNLEGANADEKRVKQAATDRFDKFFSGTNSDLIDTVNDLLRSIKWGNKAYKSNTSVILEKSVSALKGRHPTPSSLQELVSAMNDFGRLKDLETQDHNIAMPKSFGTAIKTMSMETYTLYTKKDASGSVVADPEKISELLNKVDPEAFPIFVIAAGGMDLDDLANLDPEPEAYIKRVKSVRKWAENPRCTGEATDADITCIADDSPDYYVDVSGDIVIHDTIRETLLDTITWQADGGKNFIGIKAATTSDDPDNDRELAAKFLDLLIDDLLDALENKQVFDLNDMTFWELLKDMRSECADKDAVQCDEQKANWDLFQNMFYQLLNSDQYENFVKSDYDKDMTVSEAFERMGAQGDFTEDSINAMRIKMNELMKPAVQDNLNNNGETAEINSCVAEKLGEDTFEPSMQEQSNYEKFLTECKDNLEPTEDIKDDATGYC